MNAWHSKLYDLTSADITINSRRFRLDAKRQVRDLVGLLDLRRDSLILDLPCGTGRHLLELGKRGFAVTGVDINPLLLKIASRELKKAKLKAKLSKGNILELSKYRRRFDVAINLFSSLGYFHTDSQNKRSIRELLSTLRPGGRLVIEMLNSEFMLQNYSPSNWTAEKSTVFAEVRHYDPKTRYNEGIQCFVDLKKGTVSAHYHRIRMYRSAELKKILLKQGAKKVRVFGSLAGDPFDRLKSRRMVLVAQV